MDLVPADKACSSGEKASSTAGNCEQSTQEPTGVRTSSANGASSTPARTMEQRSEMLDGAAGSSSKSTSPAKAVEPVNGCGCEFDIKEAERSGVLKRDDPIQEHYKKTGFFGAVTGAFGDKKTMFCHHLTAGGEFGTRVAKKMGVTISSHEDVWNLLGKSPCVGRFAYDRKTGKLRCGGCIPRDHDATCNKDTCIFIASGLECPIPREFLK